MAENNSQVFADFEQINLNTNTESRQGPSSQRPNDSNNSKNNNGNSERVNNGNRSHRSNRSKTNNFNSNNAYQVNNSSENFQGTQFVNFDGSNYSSSQRNNNYNNNYNRNNRPYNNRANQNHLYNQNTFPVDQTPHYNNPNTYNNSQSVKKYSNQSNQQYHGGFRNLNRPNYSQQSSVDNGDYQEPQTATNRRNPRVKNTQRFNQNGYGYQSGEPGNQHLDNQHDNSNRETTGTPRRINQSKKSQNPRESGHNVNQERPSSSATSSKKPQSASTNSSTRNKKPSNNNNSKKLGCTLNLTRREILSEQILKGKCECMVCCANIRSDKAVWSCNVCFHIFHMHCIKKWALSPSSKIEDNSDKWRCPGCQTTHDLTPHKYTCFCGKKTNPEVNRGDESKPYHLRQLPHSCGEICARQLTLSSKFWQDTSEESTGLSKTNLECKHKCLDPCHPGPCEPCDALVTRSCNCGKNKFQVKCSSTKTPICDKVCDKLLNCQLHECKIVCHSGECQPCDRDIEQTCHSHSTDRTVKCGSDYLTFKHETNDKNLHYACEILCGKLLACGNHKCESICHEGACDTCQLLPSKLTFCPCGKTKTRELLIKKSIIRTTCLDPVPTCEKKCERILHVLDDGEVHTCEDECHMGDCSKCLKQIRVKCRCAKESEKTECFERSEVKFCNRRCSRKKSCGRHQCNELCCNDKDHLCVLLCNRMLNCGLHKCDQLCHKSGQCQRCLVASFEERICECGATVEYPPIRCGTKPIECPKPCSRNHPCDHPVTHNCHWEEKCPPCSFLTSKMCHGNHEMRHNIPCYMENVSCGRLCDKKLTNCAHKCIRTCHTEPCQEADNKCQQLCKRERPSCGHACNEPCHPVDKPCPDTVCQEVVTAKCKCGFKSKQVKCLQLMNEMNLNLACELKEMLSCRSIDIGSLKNAQTLKKKSLELVCDEECFLAERNRSMALALQLDPNAKSKAIYSDFLKQFAREEPAFVFDLEKRFDTIVKEMKLSKLTKKTYHMPAMKSFERKFIHELASYYGFETSSSDSEPNRSVSVYATKDKCTLPSPILSQSIEVKQKLSTMSRLSNIKQLSSSSNPIQSNLKVLQYTEPDNYMPLSVNTFSALADQETEDVSLANRDRSEKSIDYFDMTN